MFGWPTLCGVVEGGDICPDWELGVWADIMGDPLHGGGEPPGSGWPPWETGPPGRMPPLSLPGPAFMSFLYLDRRFWNQIFTCNAKERRVRERARERRAVGY